MSAPSIPQSRRFRLLCIYTSDIMTDIPLLLGLFRPRHHSQKALRHNQLPNREKWSSEWDRTLKTEVELLRKVVRTERNSLNSR